MERPSLSIEQRAEPFPRQINTTDASPETQKLQGGAEAPLFRINGEKSARSPPWNSVWYNRSFSNRRRHQQWRGGLVATAQLRSRLCIWKSSRGFSRDLWHWFARCLIWRSNRLRSTPRPRSKWAISPWPPASSWPSGCGNRHEKSRRRSRNAFCPCEGVERVSTAGAGYLNFHLDRARSAAALLPRRASGQPSQPTLAGQSPG